MLLSVEGCISAAAALATTCRCLTPFIFSVENARKCVPISCHVCIVCAAKQAPCILRLSRAEAGKRTAEYAIVNNDK